MLADDAPSMTDWMQGWGSLLSLPLSLGALIFTGWLLRHEIRTRREERADSDAAQARLVLAGVINLSRDTIESTTEQHVGPFTGIVFNVFNHSSGPILDLSVEVLGGWLPRGIPPDDSASILPSAHGVDGFLRLDPPIAIGEDDAANDTRIRITFTDSAGLVWSRTDREQPVRVIGRSRQSQPHLALIAVGIGVVGVILGIVALLR